MAGSILASPERRCCDRSSQRNGRDDRGERGPTNGPPWTEGRGVWQEKTGGSKRMARRGRSIRPRPATLQASPSTLQSSCRIPHVAPFPKRPPPHPSQSSQRSDISPIFLPTLDRDPSRRHRVSVRQSCLRSNVELRGHKLTRQARRCRAPHAHERLWRRWKRT